MANDIEINVRVSNQTAVGLTSVNAALGRLRTKAEEASQSVTDLRTSLAGVASLDVELDDRTEAGIAEIQTRLQALAADAITVSIDDQTQADITSISAAISGLQALATDITVSIDDRTGPEIAAITGALGTLNLSAADIVVSVDDQTAPAVAAVTAAIASLEALSPVDLDINVSGGTAEIVAASAAMTALRAEADSAGDKFDALALKATAASAALAALTIVANDASDALRTLRRRAEATGSSMRDMRDGVTVASNSLRTLNTRTNTSDSRLNSLSNRASALTTNMDHLDGSLRRVGGSMAGLRGSVGSLGSSFGGASNGSRKLLMAALALSPALIPITAAVTPLIPALGAAGIALGAFGAALVPQIFNMKKLGEAHKAYREAVEESGASSKEAGAAHNAWLKELSKASPEVRQASAALSVMKDEYKEWANALDTRTLGVATKSFGVLGALFPKLTPVVRGASVELDRLMNMLNVGVHSKGFDEFMVKLADFSQRTLRGAIDGMVKFGQAMNRGIQSDGFREFLTYVRESGPAVSETLANLGRALMKLLVAAADTGVGVLAVVNAFARLVNAIPTDLLSAFLQMAFAFKAVQLAAVGFSVVGPAMLVAAAGMRSFIRSARFAGVAAAISGVVQQMTALQRASVVIAVVAGIAVAVNELAEKARGAPPDVDRLTTALKELASAGKFGGELKKTFGDIDGLVGKIKAIGVETEKAGEAAKGAFGFKIPVLDDIGNWLGTKFTEMRKGGESLRALKDDFKSLDTALTNLATSGHSDMAAESFAKIAQAAMQQGVSLEEVKSLLPEYGEAVAALQADQELAARSMGLFGEQAIAVQAKLDMQRQSAEGLRQSINALNDTYLQARGGVRGMEAAIDAATEALKKNGATLDEDTEKGRANSQALDDIAASTMKAAEATLANGAGWEAAAAIWERGRGKLLESAQAMGLTKAQAAALADQILATPDKTAVLRGNMEDLQAKLDNARAQLRTVPDSRKAEVRAEIADLENKLSRARSLLGGMKTDWHVRIHYIQTGYIPSGGRPLEYAHGGVIGAAGGGPRSRMTLVGEQGPELVDLAPGSRVRSNPDSKRIAAGMAAAGGGGGPIVVQVMLDGRMVAKAMVDPLQAEVSSRGGNVQQVLGRGN
ncbi:hypothetical protein [Streptomyces erythrochromogenes]|uniref:hypothetical protein n=1 Tax=Streptomyces erythrochromogenes TaxID=285574 RepID=UPI0037D8BDFB